ncbi:hypothetical protein, partial [Alistipes ihumii]|uniref:hypothetical protein n=1 Tax=Alistipes ihumii TaxID=1470347 RepID=UPI002672DACA
SSVRSPTFLHLDAGDKSLVFTAEVKKNADNLQKNPKILWNSRLYPGVMCVFRFRCAFCTMLF